MADDHTRKYNDWHIEKPRKQVVVPASSATAEPETTTDTQLEQVTADTAVQEGGNSNPFADAALAEQTNTAISHEVETGAPETAKTAPFVSLEESGETLDDNMQTQGEHDAATGEAIDPETGLPIPDYMKPFTNN